MINRSLRFLSFLVTCHLTLVTSPAASAAPVSFNIPPQPAPAALALFIKQSGAQVVYLQNDVKDARTNALAGSFEPKAALERLLKDTGLTFTEPKPGQFTVGRAGAKAGTVTGSLVSALKWKPIAGATVQVANTEISTVTDDAGRFELTGVPAGFHVIKISSETIRPAKIGGVTVTAGRATQLDPLEIPLPGKDGALEMKELVVEASELGKGGVKMEAVEVTGSRIRGLLGEQTLQPVLSYTREELERRGATSLGDMFQAIPQITTSFTGRAVSDFQGMSGNTITDMTNKVSATLRGAPTSGTLLLIDGRRAPRNGQRLDFSLDSYDLAGIPFAAIERVEVLLDGASAIYGADAMGGVINVILKKNYRGTELRLGYKNTFQSDASVRTASLMQGFGRGKLSGLVTVGWEKANALANQDRWFTQSSDRTPFGGTNFLPSVYGGRGVIQSTTGANLPGLSTSIAAIPAGSDGRNVTVANYATAGALPGFFDFAEWGFVTSPYERRNAAASVEYRHAPWLTAFGSWRWGWSISDVATFIPFRAQTVTIPAGAPGNPFGVPVRLNKVFWDVQDIRDQSYYTAPAINAGYTLGVRGDLGRGWRYEVSLDLARSQTRLSQDSPGTIIDATKLAAAYGSNPGQGPVLLYDSTSRSPNPSGFHQALAPNLSETAFRSEKAETWTYAAQADGPVLRYWAGDLRAALGAEFREEYVKFPYLSPASADYTQGGLPRRMTVQGFFAELRAPLIPEAGERPLLQKLEATVAARRDDYASLFPAKTVPRYGLSWRPTGWLMLRGSYGEGYKVPNLKDSTRPRTTSVVNPIVLAPSSLGGPGGLFYDPVRNEAFGGNGAYPVTQTSGGNPKLQPERSENRTAGVVLEIPRLKGLSLSWDYWDYRYLDRITFFSNSTDVITYFPQKVTRAPNLPGDRPGLPGPVVNLDRAAVNIAYSSLRGHDVALRYQRPTPWGDVAVRGNYSHYTRNLNRVLPTSPLTAPSKLPDKFAGSLFVTRGAFDTGITATYKGSFSSGRDFAATRVYSALRWDWQGSYDIDRSNRVREHARTWWGRALAGTRLSVTVFNVANSTPPVALQNGNMDFDVLDAGVRSYSLNLTRRF